MVEYIKNQIKAGNIISASLGSQNKRLTLVAKDNTEYEITKDVREVWKIWLS